jgi:hypothetical protein
VVSFTLRLLYPQGRRLGPRAGLGTVVKRKIPSPRRESNLRTPIIEPVDM